MCNIIANRDGSRYPGSVIDAAHMPLGMLLVFTSAKVMSEIFERLGDGGGPELRPTGRDIIKFSLRRQEFSQACLICFAAEIRPSVYCWERYCSSWRCQC